MYRLVSSFAVAATAAAALAVAPAGCSSLSCGKGTTPSQQPDGTIACFPVDEPATGIDCDVDGGATIVGGHCVSGIRCGAGTTLVNGQCIATGNGGGFVCATPSPGKACVSGALVDFLDNSPSTEMVHVALVDPSSYLMGGPPLAQLDTSGGYVFQDFTPPTLGLIAIIVTNPAGQTSFTTTGTGDQGVVAGVSYIVDGYVLHKSVSDGWKPAIDVDATGAFVAKFYRDAKPANTTVQVKETMPVAGVQITQNGGVVGSAKYFDTSLTTLSTTATATTAIGAAIIPAPDLSAGVPTFSGQGPSSMPITWEQLPGGSLKGAVFVDRFHPSM